MPRGAAWLLGILGGGFVAGAGLFVFLALRGATPDRVMLYISAFPGLVGLIMIGAAIQRSRFILAIAPEGVQFSRDGEVVPWSAIATFRPAALRNELRVFDRVGRQVGVIPGTLEKFERAVLTMAQVATTDAPTTPRTFEGHHGTWGWVIFAGGILYLVRDLRFDRLQTLHGAAWGWVGFLALLLVFEIRRGWGKTGRVELSIDHVGIHFRGRAGDWEARWGEIAEIEPHFVYPSRMGRMSIGVRTVDGIHHSVSVREFELMEVLASLRAFSGGLWSQKFVPPPEPQAIPLLQRRF